MAHRPSASEPMSGATDKRIVLSLSGRFAVTGPDGEPLTPKPVKEQALLVLVATSSTSERGRAWLQDKLWSTRGPQQASSSLRQALAGLRRRLGPWKHILETDNQSIRLRPDLIEVLDVPTDGEFVEGLDARDPEFEDWLAVERSRRHQPIVMPMVSARLAERRSLLLLANGAADERLTSVENFFVDCVAHTMQETLNIDIYTAPPKQPVPGLLVAKVQALQPEPNKIALRVRAENSDTSRILWSGHQLLQSASVFPYDDINVLTLGNQLVNALADQMLVNSPADQSCRDATLLGLAGLKSLFMMTEDQVRQADQNFKDAYELDPRGIFLSWRAQLRGIQFVERHSADVGELVEQGIQFAETAIRNDPGNSMVLATVSNARLILARDVAGAAQLSLQGIEANPSNPLAWWARSAASLYADQPEEAYNHALRGTQLATGSPYRFWWDMQTALSAAVAGRTDEAISMAERCSALAPNFRPPLRYLIALYTSKGDYEEASRKVARLIQLEPDFTPERLANDPNYPVSLMRRTKLLNPERLLQLR